MGNGLTVWNRLRTVDGDYQAVAHIAPDRSVTIYDADMPDEVRQRIYDMAATSDARVSATQDALVFSTPPQVREPEVTAEAIPAPPPRRERVTFTALHPEIPADQRRNFRITDPELGYGTPSEKYAANVAAIRTLKRIEAEERLATPEEQEILSRYVGWGGLPDCFDERHSKHQELKSLLNEDEYAAARASSLTAFYTSPVIIDAMYKALAQMGFQSGNILEPACGVGNFIGMIPEDMAGSHAYGVEIDSVSGRIAQQLYQNSSMVELYTIQRYLQYQVLQEMGLVFFDDWASSFGETITSIELAPEGSGYRAKTRFAKFYNLPELMATFKMAADIQTADMLKLPVPKANFHTEVIAPSELQKEMVASLAERAEEIRAGHVDPTDDNMLKVTNDGRKLALDMRLVQPLAPDDPNGKVAVCARNVFQIWEQTREQRSAQLVFCDLSTPRKDGGFDVYNDLKQKLMEKGVPEDEIAFIHDADTDVRKQALFAKVRAGTVRVLMGSTQKMGAGTNCQDRLIALHDVDCPWRPSDLAQRLGRIVRQGNTNPEVEIYRYVTEGTFDSYLYQLVENKQRFIAQIMTSKSPARVADDVDETALSYAEIKALATGNPLIIEKCELEMEVSKLQMLKAAYLNQHYSLESMVLRKYPATIAELTEKIAGYTADCQTAEEHPKPKEGFVGMTIDGTAYTDKAEAGKALITKCTTMMSRETGEFGEYRGFTLSIYYDALSKEYRLSMKGELSHELPLGADVFGNFTRMDNAIEKLQDQLAGTKKALRETHRQLDNAREELDAPFTRETELAEKSKRLNELNILLNLDQKDKTLIDSAPDEDAPEPSRSRGYER